MCLLKMTFSDGFTYVDSVVSFVLGSSVSCVIPDSSVLSALFALQLFSIDFMVGYNSWGGTLWL